MNVTLKDIFLMYKNIFNKLHVTPNGVDELKASSYSGKENAYIVFGDNSLANISPDAFRNYGKSIEGKVIPENGEQAVKELIGLYVDEGIDNRKKRFDKIFRDTTTFAVIQKNEPSNSNYSLKKTDGRVSNVGECSLSELSLINDYKKYKTECDEKFRKNMDELSIHLKEEKFVEVFQLYNIDPNLITRENVVAYFTVLVATLIRYYDVSEITNELSHVQYLLDKLDKQISTYVEENNLGLKKLTHEDFICFADVSPKDSGDKSAFKRISEFFIAPTLTLNNEDNAFKCLIEGNSGVGKTTLLKAINNIFVIENTDTTEFSDDEKCWYKKLKSKLFINFDRSYLPVFIEAKKANDQIEPYNLLDIADKYEKSLLENLVSRNDDVKALLLVDGIEEIESEQKRPLFEKAFKKFFENEEHKNVSVIVTTRYSEPFECVRSYREKITLRKLEFDSVKNYVRKSMLISSENREDIISFMSKNTDLQNFVCTPFFFEKLISNYSNELTVYEYLKKSIDSIIELRWFKARNFTKELLGYIATKGKTHSYSDFNYLISNLPESLNASLENDPKKSIKQEYDIFKSKWDSQSGILSYKIDGGESVAFEEPLAMSYLASLYIFRWFSYIEKKHNDLCDGLKDPWNIDYFKHFKLIELIDQNFDLTNIDVLRAFSLFLSRNTNGINKDDEDRNNDDDDRKMFEDRIVTMAVFLKFLSVNNNDKRLNIQSFFVGLKNRDLGISLFSNPTSDPIQNSFKSSVNYMVLDEARGEANG